MRPLQPSLIRNFADRRALQIAGGFFEGAGDLCLPALPIASSPRDAVVGSFQDASGGTGSDAIECSRKAAQARDAIRAGMADPVAIFVAAVTRLSNLAQAALRYSAAGATPRQKR
jgi:hypothetical protein